MTQIVDDGDAQRYVETGSNWESWTDSAAYQEDIRYHAAGDGSQTAAWTFDSLESGKTYQIFATWTADGNRATNAPFSISDGEDVLATVRVNQQVAPLDLIVEGTAWQSLGTYTIDSTSLAVELSTDANGYVVADALRLVEVDPVTAAPAMVDDGDAAFAQTGEDWYHWSDTDAQNDDFRYHEAGTGENATSWTFEELDPAKYYQVFVTWSAESNRATDAPFAVLDDATALATVRLNQQFTPDDGVIEEQPWESLGVYQFSSGTLNVRLTDDANGHVIADAVRIVEVASPPAPAVVVDDGNAAYAESGGGWLGWSESGAWQGDFRYHAAGTGQNAATWTFEELDPAKDYQVFVTWSAQSNRATNSPFTVLDDATALATVRVNQQFAPNEIVVDDQPWESLGVFSFSSGTLRVRLTDDVTSGYVVADAVRIVEVTPVTQAPTAVDDGDAAYAESAGWLGYSETGAYQSDFRYHAPGAGQGAASWTFGALDPTMHYQVYVTWSAQSNRSTTSPFTVLEGTTTLATAPLNQQSAPNDVTLDGQAWESLGVFQSESGTLAVRLTDDVANGYVVADAVRLVPLVYYWDPDGNAANNVIETGAGLGGGGTWATGSGAVWYNPLTGQNVAWNDDARAVFAGTGGAVSISGTVSADGITFAGDGFTVQSGTLLLPDSLETTIQVVSGSATLSAVLSGDGGLKKTGSGALVLSGDSGNTYTGVTTVTDGQLWLNKSSGVAIPGNLNIFSTNNTHVYLSQDEQIADSAVVSFSNASSNYSRLYLEGHTETVAGISDTGGRGVIQTGHLIVNNTADYTYAGYLRDNDGVATTLVKQGTGTLTLSSSKIQYTGGTTVSDGKLVLQNTTTSGFLAAGITNNAALTFSTTSADVNCTGVLAGSGTLAKIGSYTLILSGLTGNTYAGTTTVSAGGLRLNKSSGVAIPGNLNIVGSGNIYVVLDADEQIADSAVVLFDNTSAGYSRLYPNYHAETVAGISCSDGRGVIQYGDLTVNNTEDCFYNGHLRYATSLEKQGAGTLTLSGANIAYTGGTTVEGGKLVLQNTTTSGFLAAGITNNATLEFNTTSADVVYTGVLSGSGDVNKTGSYALTLGGSTGNTYTGVTTATAGTLRLAKTSGVAVPGDFQVIGDGNKIYVYLDGDEQLASSSVLTLANTSPGSSRFNLLGHSQTVAGIVCSDGRGVIQNTENESDISANGVLTVTGAGTYGYNGYLRDRYQGTSTGKVALVKNGEGKLTLDGTHITYTGTTTIDEGTLQVGAGGTSGTLGSGDVVNHGDLVFYRTDYYYATIVVPNDISGSGDITVQSTNTPNTGAYRFDGNNTFTGELHLVGARLSDGTGAENFGNPSMIYATDGGQIYAVHDTTYSQPLTISGIGLTEDVGNLGALRLMSGATWAGDITLSGDARITAFYSSGQISGDISGEHALEFHSGTSLSTDTITLIGTNTYSGATTITTGVLQADDGAGLPSTSFLCLDGGVLQSNSETSFTRSLGTSGGTFQWTENGGGFAAGGGALVVNVGGGGAELDWGAGVGSGIMGTLRLGSTTAAYATTFVNDIDLGGAARAIDVVDNPALAGDSAVIAGSLVDPLGGASLTKTGGGTLALADANAYDGLTTVAGGTLRLDAAGAIPAGSFVQLGDEALGYGTLDLNGHGLTLSGLWTDAESAAHQAAWDAVVNSSATAATLTVDNDENLVFGGTLGANLSLVKDGDGTLTLTGPGGPLASVADPDGNLIVGGAVLASAPTVLANMPMTLAAGVADPFGECESVSFYLDANANDQLDAGDTLLGEGIYDAAAGRWLLSVSTIGWGPSAAKVFAEATFDPASTHPPVATECETHLNVLADWAVVTPADPTGYAESGAGFSTVYASDAPGGAYRIISGEDADAYVEYTFRGLAPGNYEIWTHYTADSKYPSAVPVQVFDGDSSTGTLQQSFNLNETTLHWSNWEVNGHDWNWSDGFFYSNSGTVTVRVSCAGSLTQVPAIGLIAAPESVSPDTPYAENSLDPINYATGKIQYCGCAGELPEGTSYDNLRAHVLGDTGYGMRDDRPMLVGSGMLVTFTEGSDSCADTAQFLEPVRNYSPLYGTKDTLVDMTTYLKYTQANGTIHHFGYPTAGVGSYSNGFAVGPWLKTIEPSGEVIEVVLWANSSGGTSSTYSATSYNKMHEVQYKAPYNSNQAYQSELYTYITDSQDLNFGMRASIIYRTWDPTVGSTGDWVNDRMVEYDYYVNGDANGSTGDLKTVTTKYWDGSTFSGGDTIYNRYYIDSDGGTGFAHGLKRQLLPAAFNALVNKLVEKGLLSPAATLEERINAVNAVPEESGDPSVVVISPFTCFHYQYNSTTKRVTYEEVYGQLRTTTYEYADSGYVYNYQGTIDANAWSRKTIENRPDGNTYTVYSNFLGEILLTDLYDTKNTTDPGDDEHLYTYRQYDTNGHMIIDAQPSAVAGYAKKLQDGQEVWDQSVANQGVIYTDGGYSGTVHGYIYNSTNNYLQTVRVSYDGRYGTSATTVDSYTYTTPRTANGQTIYPVASQTHYENGSPVVTTYTYSWYDNRVLVKQQTITRPADGGGTVNIYKWYDPYGNLAWTKDDSGTVNYYDYDLLNNRLERSIEDISQAKANALGIVSPFGTSNNDLPTDGVDATTEYLYDVHGRVVQLTGPVETDDKRPVAWTVYDDDAHVTYFVEGCAEETSTGSGIWTVFTLSNPVLISITNKDGDVTERIAAVLTKSGSSIVWSDNPSSAPADIALDAQSPLALLPNLGLPSHTSYATWATYQYANKQLRSIHHYQTDGDQGTLGTNYTETQYGYNALGLPEWTQSADGTITWNVLDARGLTLSTWIGTNDTGATHADPSNGGTGGNNMVKVVEYLYDKDGNLTSTTEYPENAAKTNYSVAVSDMFYGERLVGDETDLTNWSLQISTYKEGSAWGLDAANSISQGYTWQKAVHQAVSGQVYVTSLQQTLTWDDHPGLSDRFDVDTAAALAARHPGFDLLDGSHGYYATDGTYHLIEPDTKLIVLEDGTEHNPQYPHLICDYDYDDAYWVVTSSAIAMNLTGDPEPAIEDLPYTLTLDDVTGTSESITGYTIHWGDGSDPETYTAAEMAAMNHQVIYTYDEPSVRTIVVDVIVGSTTCTAVAAKEITVNDIVPVVEVPFETRTLSANRDFCAPGYFVDPRAGSWTATVDYGDGGGPQSLTLNSDKTFWLEHGYAVDGIYTVTVAVTDSEGDIGQIVFSVYARPSSPPIVASLELVDGDSSSGTLVATIPTLTGQVTDNDTVAYLRVEFDWTGDDIADEITVTDEQGRFTYTPRALQPGSVVVRARAVEWNHQTSTELAGNWTTGLSFTLLDVPGPAVTGLRLVRDTGESDTDLVTTDPRVTGQVVVESGNVFGLTVEIDNNNDLSADATTLTDRLGNFTFEPQGLEPGTITIQVRALTMGVGGGTVYGEWVPLTFTYEQTTPATITNYHLAYSTGTTIFIGLDGLPIYPTINDPTVAGQVVGCSSTSWARVEFDHNSDDDADGSTMTDLSGYFTYTPRGLADGEVTIRARVAEWDARTSTYLYGEWVSITFVLETTVAPASGVTSTPASTAYERSVVAGLDFADAAIGGSSSVEGVFDNLQIGAFTPMAQKAGGLAVALDSTTAPTDRSYSATSSPCTFTIVTDYGSYDINNVVSTTYTMDVTGDAASGTFELDIHILEITSYEETHEWLDSSTSPSCWWGSRTTTEDWSLFQTGEYEWTYHAEGTYSLSGGVIVYVGTYSSTETGSEHTEYDETITTQTQGWLLPPDPYDPVDPVNTTTTWTYSETSDWELAERQESGSFNASGTTATYTSSETGNVVYEWTDVGGYAEGYLDPEYLYSFETYFESHDDFGDGSFEYTYDEEGDVAPGGTTGTYSYDESGGDQYSYLSNETWTYDYEDWTILIASSYQLESAVDGSDTYTYSEDGDFDASGDMGTYSYEESGGFIELLDGAGAYDYSSTSEYDEFGMFVETETSFYDFTETDAYTSQYSSTETGAFVITYSEGVPTTLTAGDYTWNESGSEDYVYNGSGGDIWSYDDECSTADYVFDFEESETYTYSFTYSEDGSFDPDGAWGEYDLMESSTDEWDYSDSSTSDYAIDESFAFGYMEDDPYWSGSSHSESIYCEHIEWAASTTDSGSFDDEDETGESTYFETETGDYAFVGSGSSDFTYTDPEEEDPPPQEPVDPPSGLIAVTYIIDWGHWNGTDTYAYTESGLGDWSFTSHSTTAYSPEETWGLYDVSESSSGEYHYAGGGASDWTWSSQDATATWTVGDVEDPATPGWSETFDSGYDESWTEGGLVTEDGLVGVYGGSETYGEAYSYDSAGDYQWDYECVGQTASVTETCTDHWEESDTDTFEFTYAESGAFGPGGETGVYSYTEETINHEDYSGYGDSQTNFWRSDGYHNQQTDEWDYAGRHDYSLSLSDAKSFDGDGETGVYQYTVVDEFEETYRRATGETGGSVCESDTYDWDVVSEAIYGVERENRTTVTRVFEDSVTTLTATSGYSREASSVERHMTADFLWTNAYGWGSSLSTLDSIESTVIEDSSAVVVGLEGGSSTYTRTIEAHNHGQTSGTSAYSSGESYSSSGGWDTDVGPTSVTYTDSWGTPPSTQPGQTPAAPDYAGPASEDYGELAESIAARSAAAYNDPATRAAAVDAAIAAFQAVDADEQGQGGGAVFAEVSEGEGGEEGEGSFNIGSFHFFRRGGKLYYDDPWGVPKEVVGVSKTTGMWETYDQAVAAGEQFSWYQRAGTWVLRVFTPDSEPDIVIVLEDGTKLIVDGGGPSGAALMNQGLAILGTAQIVTGVGRGIAAKVAATAGEDAGIQTTAHGAERIAGAAATRGGVLSEAEIIAARAGSTLTQADGAIVHVLETAPGRFNVVVNSQGGRLITTFKNLSQKALDRLARNYGWK